MDKDIWKNLPLLLILVFFLWPILGNKLSFIVLLIILIAVILKNLNIKKMSQTIDINSFASIKKAKSASILIIVVVLAVWLFFASIVVVDAGETGVYSLFGKVNEQELYSGFHLVIPLAKVTKMSIRTDAYTMSIITGEGKKTGADAITSLTKEGLSVDLDMTVLYRLNEENAADVYRKVGLDYEDKIIRPSIRTSIRDVIAGDYLSGLIKGIEALLIGTGIATGVAIPLSLLKSFWGI
jgi:hypothetical protein